MTNPRFSDLLARIQAHQFSRRAMLRRAAALGLAGPAIAALKPTGSLAAPRAVPVRFQIDEKTLVIATNMSSGGIWLYLDPGRFYEVDPTPLMNVVYEPLYHVPDATQPDKFEPLLATDFPKLSEDGKVATIKLRPGVKFHTTGNEVTADDWVFAFKRTKNLKGNPSYLATDYWTDVEAVDPTTLKITLDAPQPALVAILTTTALSVIDSKAIQEHGGTDAEDADQTDKATDWLNSNSIGTGPYKVSQWDVNSEVIIEANPDYWGEPPAFERMIWRNIVDTNSQLEAVEAGEADIAFALDPDAVAQVEANPDLQVLEGDTISFEYLALHTQPEPGGPLANKQVRQAIAHAIDYQGIIDGLLTGAAVRPATVVPLPMAGTEAVQPEAYQTDLAKAQELFDAANVGTVEVTLSYRAEGQGQGNVDEQTLATKLQADIQRIKGLTVKLNPMDANTWIDDYRHSKLQFVLASWGPDYPDIQSYVDPFGRSTAAVAKRVGYNNPTVDKTLDQIIAETDPAKKEELYVAVQRALIEDAPWIALYQPKERKAARKVVEGVQVHYLYALQLRYAKKTG